MKISVHDLSFKYASTPVLEHVTFDAQPGQCVAVLGVNGAGKSTLLKCIARILPHCMGSIQVDGREINNLPPLQRAKMVGYVPQTVDSPDMTVFDTVMLGRLPYIHWEPTKQDQQIVCELLQKLNLQHIAMRNAATLSGGELQKVAVARVLAQQAGVLLFDEPTSNLDVHNQLEVVNLIRDLAREKHISAIVTMHDLNLALRFADRFLLMKDKTIRYAGDASVITPDSLHDIFNINASVVQLNGRPLIIPD